MRISCPYCGERSHAEFTYLGDAAPVRPPEPARHAAPDQAALDAFSDYVYIRTNPPGTLHEWWQHTGGCRAWLRVERNVTTHEIGAVTAARAAAGGTREISR